MTKDTWYCADHHFAHPNIAVYTKRKARDGSQFENSGEMDAHMIRCWNEVVQHEDTVYYLGDFTLMDGKRMLPYLDRLVGRIKFVPGGHDLKWMKDLGIKPDMGRQPLPRPYHKHEVLPMIYFQKIRIPSETGPGGGGTTKKQLIVLSHYPQFTWERSHRGSWHLHGHSHGGLGKGNRYQKIVKSPPSTLEDGRSMDIGVDAGWDFYPVNIATVIDRLDGKELPSDS